MQHWSVKKFWQPLKVKQSFNKNPLLSSFHLKEAFFFWYWISDFGPNYLGSDLGIVWLWECVRSKAYYLKMILHTHTMVIRPLENFLPALEVGWVQNQGSQKVDKNMDFWVSDLVPTDSVGKEVDFMHYYTHSTCFCLKW